MSGKRIVFMFVTLLATIFFVAQAQAAVASMPCDPDCLSVTEITIDRWRPGVDSFPQYGAGLYAIIGDYLYPGLNVHNVSGQPLNVMISSTIDSQLRVEVYPPSQLHREQYYYGLQSGSVYLNAAPWEYVLTRTGGGKIFYVIEVYYQDADGNWIKNSRREAWSYVEVDTIFIPIMMH